MKKYIILLALVSGLCFGDQHTNPNETHHPVAVANDSKQTIINALKMLFKDPATGKIKTDSYITYLKWQTERTELVREIQEADSDLKKQMFARRLVTLDRDFRVFNTEILRAMDVLVAAKSTLYKEDSTLAKIQEHDGETYAKWEKDRTAVVEQIKKETNDQKRLFLANKLVSIDQIFKIQFMGFLLGLSAD